MHAYSGFRGFASVFCWIVASVSEKRTSNSLKVVMGAVCHSETLVTHKTTK
jgi:hypothetical protein